MTVDDGLQGRYVLAGEDQAQVAGPDMVKLLTEDIRGITDGLLNVERDAVKAAEGIHQHIESKRKGLGL
jgi:carbon-monoxide dehydrogenase catalytic subunit